MLVVAALCAGGPALADTLGDARQLSRLGEPLRLSIPVRPDGGAPLQEACLAVVMPPQSDGLAHILTANVVAEHQGAATTVSVTTANPVRDPVIRLLLRTTCDGATRSYALFLEPPGSTRQVRAVSQPGPRVGANGEPSSAAARAARADAAKADAATRVELPPPVVAVTTIPVVPPSRPAHQSVPATQGIARPVPAAPATTAPKLSTASDVGLVGAATPAGPLSDAGGAGSSSISTAAGGTPDPNVLEAENQNLRARVAELNGELEKLQQAHVADAPKGAGPVPRTAPPWELAWPVIVALIGLAALILGGFMWRRHHAGEEWPLTGPPSHRVVSRTSLAEDPVPFKQAGVQTDVVKAEAETVGATANAPALRAVSANTPAALLVQPSADDLGRDLEQELFIAERAHSSLERAHPDLVDTLTRSWGTAAARAELAALLNPASPELMRMSGEAVAELRLLLRIADDFAQRTTPQHETSFGRAAPAW